MGFFAFLAGWFAKIIGINALRFTAWKIILWALVVSVFPTVLYNVLSGLLTEMYSVVAGVSGSQAPFVVTLTGCAGYLGSYLKLTESFSLIISSLMFRFAVNMIPFVGKL